jgi:ADP-ribose pyrophosphatase YjhB (NUDIX family)
MNELKEIGNSKMCPGVVLVREGRVLIGLRHYTPDKWKTVSVWTVPGGRCDDGETLEQALRREVAEEVGITDFEITELLGKAPGAKEGDTLYLFKGATNQEAQLLEPEKFSEWKWVSKEDVPENFISFHSRELIKKSL